MNESLLSTFAPLVTLVGGVLVTLIVMRQRSVSEPQRPLRSETDKLFQAGFDRAPVGIAYMATDGTWLHANPKLVQMLGYERADFDRTNLRMLTHPEDRKREAGMMAAMRAGRTRGFSMVKRLAHKDGSYHAYRFSISRIGGGSSPIFQCILDETPEQAEAESDLFHAFDDVPELSVVRLDTRGMIVTWNRGARELFGFTEAEMKGKPWTRLHSSSLRRVGEANRELAIAAANGKYEGMDERKRQDGTEVRVQVVLVPQFRGTELEGFIEVSRDASVSRAPHEYKDAYDRLRQMTDEKVAALTEANQALSRKLARYEENQHRFRDAHHALMDRNRELTERVRMLAAAVKKVVEQRSELEARVAETDAREVEELAATLPADIVWTTAARPSEVFDVARQRGRGVVFLRSGEAEKRITLHDGAIISASSNSTRLLLGQMLVDLGAISERDRQKMIEVQNQTGITFGRLLLLFELMNEDDVRVAMETKIREELEEIATWSLPIEWSFVSSDEMDDQIVPVSVSLPDWTVEAVGTVEPTRAPEGETREPERLVGAEVGAEPEEEGRGESADSSFSEANPEASARSEAKRKPRKAKRGTSSSKPGRSAEPVFASASSRAGKFHRRDCSSIARVGEEALINFESATAARENGLTACARCGGTISQATRATEDRS